MPTAETTEFKAADTVLAHGGRVLEFFGLPDRDAPGLRRRCSTIILERSASKGEYRLYGLYVSTPGGADRGAP